MALPTINYTRSEGNLVNGSNIDSEVSGLLFDVAAAPSGMTIGIMKDIISIEHAESLGIKPSTDVAPYDNGLPHFHIDEYFKTADRGVLKVMFANLSTSFGAVVDIQDQSEGKIFQLGIYTRQLLLTDGSPYVLDSMVDDIQAQVELLRNDNRPLSVLLSANYTNADGAGKTDLAELPDLKDLPNDGVTVLMGQGNDTFVNKLQGGNANQAIVGWLGQALATVAVSALHESIAWVGAYDLTGDHNAKVAFGAGDITLNGDVITDNQPYEQVSKAYRDSVDDKGWVFLMKYTDDGGRTRVNNSYTASGGDYDSIERNRVIDASRRLTRRVLLPFLNSPVDLNKSNGKMDVAQIKVYKTAVEGALDTLVQAGNINGHTVIIDASQDVLATKTLYIQYKLSGKGKIHDIDVTEGFSQTV